MTISMNDSHMSSITQLEEFLKASNQVSFQAQSREEKYEWITEVLCRFKYFTLKRKEKGVVKKYVELMTGYSRAQANRLIAKQKADGELKVNNGKRNKFPKKYTYEDILLLTETDKAHDRLSGPATKKILERQYNVFGEQKYERLSRISTSHIYNLRKETLYTTKTRFFTKTKPTQVSIGERRKPISNGEPGFLRVDTVHQGDFVDEKGQKKGVYHINIVDEVTQWEIVGSVEAISERFLAPLLEDLLKQFPFIIQNFHSDNGSEYINQLVAKLLNKLLIKQTKSRPRHSNDNGLAETKNGGVIRKHMGYRYIDQQHAAKINDFYRESFNPYLNFHRPSGFATTTIDRRGKEKKVYNVYQTPFEALKSHSQASKFLKDGITVEQLQKIALEMSDNEAGSRMKKAKMELFKSFKH